MDFNFDPDSAKPWAMVGAVGMLGRLMYHAKLVQLGQRKPISWALFWDIPIALGMGWIAFGLATWWALQWEVTVSLALVVSYLGPYGIDTAFAAYSDRLKKAKEGTPNDEAA